MGEVWWGNLEGPRDWSQLCVQQALIYQTFVFLCIAFLLTEVPKHYSQHSLVSLAESGIEGEGFDYFVRLVLLHLSLVYVLLNPC